MAKLLFETTNVKVAIDEEQALAPGRYEVRLNLLSPISREELVELHAYFLDQGVDIKGCLQQRIKGLYQITIKYRKHAISEAIAQPQALIPLIPIFLLAILVGIGLFKLGGIIEALTPILLGAMAVGTVILIIVRKPVAVAAAKYT